MANRRKRKSGRMSRIVGMEFLAFQVVVSIAFMVFLYILNMLPTKYLIAAGGALLLLALLTLFSQLLAKGKAIPGKVFSVIVSVILIFGSYYVLKVNGTVDKISGSSYKIDKIVVAVLDTDPAKTIEDAADYNFGVQYTSNGDDIKDTVKDINKKLGKQIQTTEYNSVGDQAEALHGGAVKAIIYNEAHEDMLNEIFEGHSEKIRILDTKEIKKKVAVQTDAAAQTAAAVTDKPFNVYISGIDVFGDIATNSRSDVNIIATVNPTTHQILLSTTPRDFYVEIPNLTEGQKDKLTHAGIYGVDYSMGALEAFYNTDIGYYLRVNFTSVVQIVNTLGGVDVYSAHSFVTDPDTGMEMQVNEGMNHFNGEQALAFSRERKRVPMGDIDRGKNQQAVITAILKKMISPAMLTGASGILNSVSGNIDTNLTSEQLQSLVKGQLATGAKWNIKSLAATGTGADMPCWSYKTMNLDVLIPDQASVDAIKTDIANVLGGQTLSDSEAVN